MQRWILMTVVALTLTTFAWFAKTSSATDFTESWTFGGFPDKEFLVGDTLTFEFSGGHDVWEFPDEASYNDCDFDSATFLGSSTFTVTFNTEGIRYFGCSVGSHCDNSDMKVRVTTMADTSLFIDGFESGNVTAWTSSSP